MCKKWGGDTFLPTAGSSSESVGLLPGEKHYSLGGVPPRSPEHGGRLGIEKFIGLQRLEAGRESFPGDKQGLGTSGNRLICQQAQCSVGQIRELASGPLCSGSGRFSARMGEPEGLFVSPLLHDTKVFGQGIQGEGHGGDYHSGMVVSGVVSHAARDVHSRANPVTSHTEFAQIPSERATPLVRPTRTQVSGLESVREQALARGISAEAAEILSKHSWRKGTSNAYESAWRQWCGWCEPQQIDPLHSSVESVVNYLTEKFIKGDKYNTLNTHRSAISAFHRPVDTVKVGQHPTVSAMMAAFFNARPPMPRYEVTWDVDIVLKYLLELGDNSSLALKQLTFKMSMLLALACAGRSSDVGALDIRFLNLGENKVHFTLAKLTKSRRKGKPPIKIELSKFEGHSNLCVISTLNTYLERTRLFRERKDGKLRHQLLLSFVEPHHAVVSCTIAGWLIKVMSEAGIDVETFRAHSTRGAATSKAAAKGLSCKEIMGMAKWTRKSTFEKHYHKEIVKTPSGESKKFEAVVLSN